VRNDKSNAREVVIIGIDPGLAATGYGIVRRNSQKIECLDYGCITTSAKAQTPERLRVIYDGILALMKRWAPEMAVLEEVFMKRATPSTALSIGQVRGIVLLAAAEHSCTVLGIQPRSVKLALTGSGAADKSQVEKGLRRILGIPGPISPDHAADALGLAYVGAMRGIEPDL